MDETDIAELRALVEYGYLAAPEVTIARAIVYALIVVGIIRFALVFTASTFNYKDEETPSDYDDLPRFLYRMMSVALWAFVAFLLTNLFI